MIITNFINFKNVHSLNEDVYSTTYSPNEYDTARDPGDTTDAGRDQLPVGVGGEDDYYYQEEKDPDYKEEETVDSLRNIEVSLNDMKQLLDVIKARIEKLEA